MFNISTTSVLSYEAVQQLYAKVRKKKHIIRRNRGKVLHFPRGRKRKAAGNRAIYCRIFL